MRNKIISGACATLATAAVLGVGLAAAQSDAAPSGTSGLAASLIRTVSSQSQTVPVTVQPNASQAVLIPVPSNNDFTTIPLITPDNPNLVMASATYSADQKNLVVSVMNADPNSATSGKLAVAGWGSYDVTVQPNPNQLVYVDLPAGYDTSKLPVVTSESPNLRLFSLTYGYVDGVQKLQVNLGNPFPTTAVSGQIRVAW
jgi:hypothetical protein